MSEYDKTKIKQFHCMRKWDYQSSPSNTKSLQSCICFRIHNFSLKKKFKCVIKIEASFSIQKKKHQQDDLFHCNQREITSHQDFDETDVPTESLFPAISFSNKDICYHKICDKLKPWGDPVLRTILNVPRNQDTCMYSSSNKTLDINLQALPNWSN